MKLEPKNGLKVKASDGNIYTLSLGNDPKNLDDIVWLDANGHESSRKIDRELMRRLRSTQAESVKLKEYASGGATSSGSIAGVVNPIGSTISRTPNLFGYIPQQVPLKKKRKKIKKL